MSEKFEKITARGTQLFDSKGYCVADTYFETPQEATRLEEAWNICRGIETISISEGVLIPAHIPEMLQEKINELEKQIELLKARTP